MRHTAQDMFEAMRSLLSDTDAEIFADLPARWEELSEQQQVRFERQADLLNRIAAAYESSAS